MEYRSKLTDTHTKGFHKMKITIINGSPKKETGDTMHITNAFVAGMNEFTQNEIKIIHATEKNINYCTGCFTCMHNGGTCIHTDDMKEILTEITTSDLLIFSFPLYCYGMPAPLKAIVDRLLPLTSMKMEKTDGDRYAHVAQTDVSRLRFMMICGCGFPNSKQNFEPAIAQFKLMFPRGNTIITVPESPMFNAPDAAVVTVPRLDLIRRAGREYAESGVIPENMLSEICSPMIPEEVYAEIVNGER